MYKDLGYMYEFVMRPNTRPGVSFLLRKTEPYIVIYIYLFDCVANYNNFVIYNFSVLTYINRFKKNYLSRKKLDV